MNRRIIPIVSVAVGVLAFLLTYRYIQGERKRLLEVERQIYEGARKIRVVVAKRDIPGGTSVKTDDLGVLSVFESAVRGHAVTPDKAELLLGRKTLFPIKAKDPIFWSDIEGGAMAGEGLASVIKPGLRAISLSVGSAAAVSSMIQPNDRVDVLGTFTLPSRNTPGEMETATLTVLQDVTVLATGRELAKQQFVVGRGRASYSMVTVEVTPREAELLVFAQQMKGSLTLALRNPSDVSYEENLPEVDFQYLQSTIPELNAFRQRNIRHKRDR